MHVHTRTFLPPFPLPQWEQESSFFAVKFSVVTQVGRHGHLS